MWSLFTGRTEVRVEFIDAGEGSVQDHPASFYIQEWTTSDGLITTTVMSVFSISAFIAGTVC